MRMQYLATVEICHLSLKPILASELIVVSHFVHRVVGKSYAEGVSDALLWVMGKIPPPGE
ncbi:hypothetical protein [Photobacterium lipolyticum]|uniref:hypothetical protein n=1 Tax=Photobacterium lipolyticum TaxID=266810 RepID=UPI0011B1F7B3|nr:hypothetical protein [Photobacterium lipolyticum]